MDGTLEPVLGCLEKAVSGHTCICFLVDADRDCSQSAVILSLFQTAAQTLVCFYTCAAFQYRHIHMNVDMKNLHRCIDMYVFSHSMVWAFFSRSLVSRRSQPTIGHDIHIRV